uniref:Rhodanese domain-containing protein n=1 Tax=Entomoneis paludosa TaxID=265537 RepID=A0A7S2YGH5_9STRA|mmetsp:Transcript_32132/g.67016  ORF Transcript_32132/g.67016 Transcript_32132/m.67016 type:complete len:176 (+) Transcript_32132:41-568(+)
MMWKSPILLIAAIISSPSQAAAFVPSTLTTSRLSRILQSHPDEIAQLRQDFDTNGVKAKAVLLDLRELDEWTAGHLQAATPAPLSTITSGKWMDMRGQYYPGTFPIDRRTGVAIVKNLKIYLIHDDDAQTASSLFQKMGYSNVISLSENYEELATAYGVSSIVAGGVDRLTDDNG